LKKGKKRGKKEKKRRGEEKEKKGDGSWRWLNKI